MTGGSGLGLALDLLAASAVTLTLGRPRAKRSSWRFPSVRR